MVSTYKPLKSEDLKIDELKRLVVCVDELEGLTGLAKSAQFPSSLTESGHFKVALVEGTSGLMLGTVDAEISGQVVEISGQVVDVSDRSGREIGTVDVRSRGPLVASRDTYTLWDSEVVASGAYVDQVLDPYVPPYTLYISTDASTTIYVYLYPDAAVGFLMDSYNFNGADALVWTINHQAYAMRLLNGASGVTITAKVRVGVIG